MAQTPQEAPALTPTQINKQKFLDTLADYGGEIRATSKALNIKEATVYMWTARDLKFKEALAAKRKEIEATQETALATTGDTAIDATTIEDGTTTDLFTIKLERLNNILLTGGVNAKRLEPLLESAARAQAVEELAYNRVIATGGNAQNTRLYLEAAKVSYNLLSQCGLKLDAKHLKTDGADEFNRLMFMLHYREDPEVMATIKAEARQIANVEIEKYKRSLEKKTKRR